MSGMLTNVRALRARPTVPRFAVRSAIERRRQRAVEREYRRMVASGQLPREFGAPLSRGVVRRRGF